MEDEENEEDVEQPQVGENGESGGYVDSDETEFTDEIDPEEVDNKIAADYMAAVKKLVRGEEGLDENVALEAVDLLCRAISRIVDPQERAITLFISKRYIMHAVAKIENKCSKAVVNANKMLSGIPGSKKKLLLSLNLTEDEFNKLVLSYANKYTRTN